LIVAGGFVFED